MKLARIAIFLTGMIGLGAGGLVTISTLKSSQDEEVLRTNATLKSQASLLVDQFYSVLETLKHAGANKDAIPSYVLETALVKYKDGSPSAFESFSSEDPELEERLTSAMKEQVLVQDLRLGKPALGMIEHPNAARKLGMFIAEPVLRNGGQGSGNEENLDKVRLTVLDPVKAFPGLEKMSSSNQAGFLLHRSGRILAHSVPAFVGTDLRRLEGLRDAIENLFLGAGTGAVLRYTQVDGTRESLALVRAGVLPFAFAVEQKAPSAVLSAEWMREQFASGAARRNIGVAFLLMAVALLLFAVLSSWASRGVRNELEKARKDRADRHDEVPLPSAVSDSTGDFLKSLDGLDSERRQNREIARELGSVAGAAGSSVSSEPASFLERIAGIRSRELLERELVAFCASDFSPGGAVFFRYQRSTQNLSPGAQSGGVTAESSRSHQIYVRKDIELQVEQLSDAGKVASITHYAPIKKMVQDDFRGKTYEAWAVTSTPEVSGQSRLVGVLLLIEPGSFDAGRRALLGRTIKEAGNYLYAQGNRLQPKGVSLGAFPGLGITKSPDPA